jgi:hypothetical protein
MTAEVDVLGILADQIPGIISIGHNNHLKPPADRGTSSDKTNASRLLASHRHRYQVTDRDFTSICSVLKTYGPGDTMRNASVK